jgi:hypothetical protein
LGPDQAAYRQQVIDELEKTSLEGLSGEEVSRLAEAVKRLKGEEGAINPELAEMLAMRIAPGIGGAMAGSAVDDEDRLRGAVLGGAAGLVGPSAIKKVLGGMGAPSATGAPPSLGDRLVNWQRFSLLSNPYNLMVNSLAPTGGAAMGSVEQMLSGLVGKGLNRSRLAGKVADNLGTNVSEPDALQQGVKGLKASLNPGRFKPSAIMEDADDAKRLMREAEENRADMSMEGGTPRYIDRVMAVPAQIMTTGDLGARKGLMGAGWSEDLARAVTVTSEPRYALGKAIVNMARTGGNVARFILPFSRTATNVVEGSLERTPLLGMMMQQSSTNPEAKAALSELVARQGMGGAVTLMAYQLGAEIDPETSKTYKLPLVVANMSGQYGALAAAAFAAGMAAQNGRADTFGDKVGTGASRLLQDLPLPTTESAAEVIDAGTSYLKGEPPNPNATHAPQRWLPDNLTPRLLKDEAIDSSLDIIKPRSRYRPISGS